jgi:hypothetical protein
MSKLSPDSDGGKRKREHNEGGEVLSDEVEDGHASKKARVDEKVKAEEAFKDVYDKVKAQEAVSVEQAKFNKQIQELAVKQALLRSSTPSPPFPSAPPPPRFAVPQPATRSLPPATVTSAPSQPPRSSTFLAAMPGSNSTKALAKSPPQPPPPTRPLSALASDLLTLAQSIVRATGGPPLVAAIAPAPPVGPAPVPPVPAPVPSMTITYPATWQAMTSPHLCVNLALDSVEARSVTSPFPQNAKVTAVTRVQNLLAFQTYVCKREALRSAGHPTERLMYHGCPDTAIDGIIANGFDLRLASTQSAAGAGIYFAEQIRTAVRFNRIKGNTPGKILVSRVALGLGTTLTELKASLGVTPVSKVRYPQSRSATDPTPFDSVSANMVDDPLHPMVVVYNPAQTLVEYIVTCEWTDVAAPAPPVGMNNPIIVDPRTTPIFQWLKAYLPSLEMSLSFVPNGSSDPIYALFMVLKRILTEDPFSADSYYVTARVDEEELKKFAKELQKAVPPSAVQYLFPETIAQLRSLNSPIGNTNNTTVKD